MEPGDILWPLVWIWIGAAIGFFGAALLRSTRSGKDDPPGSPERSSLLERVVTLTGAPVATLQWDVRLKDERGQSILAGTGDTPEAALQAAIDQGSASIARADGAA